MLAVQVSELRRGPHSAQALKTRRPVEGTSKVLRQTPGWGQPPEVKKPQTKADIPAGWSRVQAPGARAGLFPPSLSYSGGRPGIVGGLLKVNI